MTAARVKIEGITRAAFEAQPGVVHYSRDYDGAICGVRGWKFTDGKGTTCKRCKQIMKQQGVKP